MLESQFHPTIAAILKFISLTVIMFYSIVIVYYYLAGPFDIIVLGSRVHLSDLEKPLKILLSSLAILLLLSQKVYLEMKIYFVSIKPLVATGIVLVIYLGICQPFLRQNDNEILSFVHFGEHFCDSNCPESHLAPNVTPIGYDGQAFYRLALDPFVETELQPKLDAPAYRQQRIFYPLLARFVSLGNPTLIPWALVGINLIAIMTITYTCVSMMACNNKPHWLGLVFPLYIGFKASVLFDLPEPLAIMFVILGLSALRADKHLYACIYLSLAVLTRETTLIVAVAILISAVYDRWTEGAVKQKHDLLALASVGLLPVFTFTSVQLWLFNKYGAFSVQQQNNRNFSYPFSVWAQIDKWSIGEHPVYSGNDIALLIMYELTAVIAIAFTYKSNVARHEKIALLIYSVMAIFYGGAIWEYNINYIRALSELYLFSMLVIVFWNGHATRKLSDGLAFTWICLFFMNLRFD